MEYKASYHQERLWFIEKFEKGNVYEGSPIYHNIPLLFQVKGKVNALLLEQSIRQVIHRHHVFQTRIITKDSMPFQVIGPGPAPDFKLEYLDLSNYPGEDEDKTKHARASAITFAQKAFNLESSPLTRALLIQIAAGNFIFVLSIHHIIADRYSLRIVTDEIFTCYEAFYHDQTPVLPILPAHYADFSQWQQALSDEMLDPVLSYWKIKLKGKLTPLQLPTDSPRAPIHIYHDAGLTFKIEGALFQKIKEFCRSPKNPVWLVVLAAFKVLLSRYCSQEEIIIGLAEKNRDQPGLEQIVGPIANLVVLRSFLDEKSNFLKVLKDLENTTGEARKYKDIPFERLDQALNPPKDMSRTVFFDVLFQYEEKPQETIYSGQLEIQRLETNLGYGKYDLNLLLQEHAGSITGILVYNKDYYNESTIKRFTNHYLCLLENILAEPDRAISAPGFLTGEEKQQLLYGLNITKVEYPRNKTIHQLFIEQAERTPDRIAVFGHEPVWTKTDTNITYRELHNHSGQLAYVLQEKGALPDHIIAVSIGRSPEMIIGLLGILKAGSAYLPIDLEYPQERIYFMLKDSNTKIIVVNKPIGPDPSNNRLAVVNCAAIMKINRATYHPLSRIHHPNQLAYVIYTSGTTGRPKGTLIEHGNVVRLLFNDAFQFHFSSADTWTMFHSYCFDFSVWEMYGALLYGGKLIIVPKLTAQDAGKFLELLLQQCVTILNQTPSSYYRLADEAAKQDKNLLLKYIIFGGEALNPNRLKEWKTRYPGTKLVNMYGITETTVHVTYKEISPREIELAASNIGKAIPTLTLYVLDKNMNPVPFGVTGELFIGGDGLGRGYLNQPSLTAEKFIHAVPFMKGGRLYRSGDLVKRLENGEMVYQGRMDNQVKIRGHRIELGEIENQLSTHGAVKNPVVIARQDKNNDPYLCAYFTIPSSLSTKYRETFLQAPATQLRDYLTKKLPDYMVPSFFVPLESIPLTENGKIDRNALPEPEIDTGDAYVAPRNEVEKGIAYIISDVLGINYVKISARANIFDLGVNSLTLIKIAQQISNEFNKNIQLGTLFTNPTIELIAAEMQNNFVPAAVKRPVLLNRPAAARNLFLISGDGVVYGMKELARLLEGHFNVYGIQARGITDTDPLPEFRDEIYDEYINQMKRVQPEGPYFVGGHCFGAIISYEIARVLEDRKDKVGKIIFFDEPSIMSLFYMEHMIINKIYNLNQSIKKFFITISRKKKKTINPKTGILPENLEARRIEIQDNFRRLFGGNFKHFRRIINSPVLVFKALEGDNPDSHRWLPQVIIKMSKQPVHLLETPGDHFTMFDLPHVEVLAQSMVENIPVSTNR